MIIGAHSILYSKNPDADRRFLQEVLKFPHVDAGGGWLIFGLPPAEVAVHLADENDRHELYLICEDVAALVETLRQSNVTCSSVQEQQWGSLVHVDLPGGGKLGIYQPKHARPGSTTQPSARQRAPARRAAAPKRTQKRAKRGTREARKSK
jgi:hypothetical protein